MLQVGTRIRVKDEDESEYKGWTGTIIMIDAHAAEGDCYGVQFGVTGDDVTVFFRADEIQAIALKEVEQ